MSDIKISIVSADSYNGVGNKKGVNVNSQALFIKFNDREWQKITSYKSKVKALKALEKQIYDVLGIKINV